MDSTRPSDAMRAAQTDRDTFASFGGMGQAILSAAEKWSEYPAFRDLDNKRSFSYADIGQCIQGLCEQFEAKGLKRGDSVATNLSNGPDLAALILGSLVYGLRLALIEPQTPASKLKFYIDLVAPKAGFFSTDIAASPEIASFDAGLRNPADTAPLSNYRFEPSTELKDEAIVIFSSGTTGAPKGIVHTHQNIIAEVGSMIKAYDLHPGMKHYLLLTLAHVSGLYRGLIMPFCSGGIVHMRGSFDPKVFWQDIEREDIEFVQLVPSHIALLNRAPFGPSDKTPKSLRFIGTASAHLPPKEQTDFESRFGVPILQGYGLTECTCGIVLNSLDPSVRRPGVVGLPLSVNEIAIMDNDGVEVGNGEVGELWVRGPNVSVKYLGSDQPNIEGGWLKTGDLGRFEGDGNLVLVGRRANLISRGAYKIYSVEVEDALNSIPGVREAAVIGVPNPILGQDIVGFITSDHALDTQQILGALRQKISSFKVPTQIISVDKMPQNALGKVRKDVLRSDYDARQASRSAVSEGEIMARLCQLIASIFALDAASINSDSSRESIEPWDSLGHLQVLAGIEQTFWVKIPEEAAAKTQTVGDLAALIVHTLRTRI